MGQLDLFTHVVDHIHLLGLECLEEVFPGDERPRSRTDVVFFWLQF